MECHETNEPKTTTEKSYAREVLDIFNVAGWQKLTPKEQSFIRKAEIPEQGAARNEPKEQLFNISLVVLEKQREGGLQLKSKIDTMPPYPFVVFHTAAVFTDKQKETEFITPVANERSVQEFINRVIESPEPVDVAGQFDILLKLSDGSIVDAAAIGMMASRLVARNLDKRLYPNTHVDNDIQAKFHKNLPIFGDPDKPNDRLGDNYYFWTSVYTACSLSDEHPFIRTLDEHNAKIMTLSRQFFARQPTITDHRRADALGKQASEIFIKVTEKSDNDPTTIPINYLESLPESARIAVLVNKLEQIETNAEITISDPNSSIAKGLYSFDALQYFSALPGVSTIYNKRPKDWNGILNAIRYRVPSVSFSIDSSKLIIKKRQSELSDGLKAQDINADWIKDQVDKISNEHGRKLLKQWIAVGCSTTDSPNILIKGGEISKYNEKQNLLVMIQYPDERRKYFSDEEWEKVIDIISVSIDNSQGFLNDPTVFQRTHAKLARSTLILPSDGITPHVGSELIAAVDGIDSAKVAREDKIMTFAETMTDLNWYDDNKDNLDKLSQVDPYLRNIAILYLRQSVLSFLSSDMDNARKITRETFSRVLNQLRQGTDSEKKMAKEALDIVCQIGLQYESDPVYSLLAAMHDPSVYGTARYRLDRRMMKVSDAKLATAFAKQIIKLTNESPKSIIRHQNSLSRKLSCPSCYGYAGGLAAQGDIQAREFSDTLHATNIPDSKILFANELGNWVRGEIV
jgi:hypothetical protein